MSKFYSALEQEKIILKLATFVLWKSKNLKVAKENTTHNHTQWSDSYNVGQNLTTTVQGNMLTMKTKLRV